MKNNKTKSKAQTPERENPCGYCGGNGRNLEHEDFCPSCHAPSRRYKKMIAAEMIDQMMGY